jgi:hypothetical protein
LCHRTEYFLQKAELMRPSGILAMYRPHCWTSFEFDSNKF